MPGARCARGLVCKVKKHTSVVTTVTPETPGIPRAMVLTASFVLFPAIGLVVTVVCSFNRQLDASVGTSGPHDFAVCGDGVSSGAKTPDAIRIHRIPHPTFVTIAKRPSGEAGRGELVKMICPTAQAYIFRNHAGRPDQLEWIFEFAFLPVSALSIPAF
jgi:hypothetical protein